MNTAIAAHVVPSLQTVVQQQMRLLWMSRRVLFLNILLLISLAVPLWIVLYVGEPVDLLLLELFPAVLAISLLWGFLIWRDEPPKQRTYHWSLPVDMATHDMARVCAGAIWLLTSIALFIVAGIVVVLTMGDPDPIMRAAPLLGLQYLLGPVTLYLLMTAWSTALNRAVEMLVLSYVGLLALIALQEWLEMRWFVDMMRFVAGPPYGIASVLVAAFEGAAVHVKNPQQAPVSLYMTEWLPYAVLWVFIAAGIVGGAAMWRRGRA